MTKKIWTVSSGSYSDYGVDYICTDARLAAQIAGKLSGEYFVEEKELVESIDDLELRPFTRHWIELDREGEIIGEGRDAIDREPWPDHGGIVAGVRPYYEEGDPEPEGSYKPRPWQAGSNKRRALQAARDRLAERKAIEAGIAP